jgi:hypothetical protein
MGLFPVAFLLKGVGHSVDGLCVPLFTLIYILRYIIFLEAICFAVDNIIAPPWLKSRKIFLVVV